MTVRLRAPPEGEQARGLNGEAPNLTISLRRLEEAGLSSHPTPSPCSPPGAHTPHRESMVVESVNATDYETLTSPEPPASKPAIQPTLSPAISATEIPARLFTVPNTFLPLFLYYSLLMRLITGGSLGWEVVVWGPFCGVMAMLDMDVKQVC